MPLPIAANQRKIFLPGAWVALTGRVVMALAFVWALGAIIYEALA